MNLIKFFSVAARLASLQRFSMERLTSRESVLEHTGFVALTSYALAVEVNARGTILMHGKIVCVDTGRVVTRAIAHDADEIITGDIARPTKYSSREALALFRHLSSTSMVRIADELSDMPAFSDRLTEDHENAKEGREGALVAIADMLAVVYKVWDEVIVHGNHTMVRQAIAVQEQLRNYRGKINLLFGSYVDVRNFLSDVLYQAEALAAEAAANERPVLGTMRENFCED